MEPGDNALMGVMFRAYPVHPSSASGCGEINCNTISHTFIVCEEKNDGGGGGGCDYECPGCPCPPRLLGTCADYVPKDYIVWLNDIYGFTDDII
jgi:hypothetical protein